MSGMRKSDMTVTMPLATWEEYEKYKKDYESITGRLAECFDGSLMDAGAAVAVDFDARKALAVCREFMPYSMEGSDIEIKA